MPSCRTSWVNPPRNPPGAPAAPSQPHGFTPVGFFFVPSPPPAPSRTSCPPPSHPLAPVTIPRVPSPPRIIRANPRFGAGGGFCRHAMTPCGPLPAPWSLVCGFTHTYPPAHPLWPSSTPFSPLSPFHSPPPPVRCNFATFHPISPIARVPIIWLSVVVPAMSWGSPGLS